MESFIALTVFKAEQTVAQTLPIFIKIAQNEGQPRISKPYLFDNLCIIKPIQPKSEILKKN